MTHETASRRRFLKAAGAIGMMAAAGRVGAQNQNQNPYGGVTGPFRLRMWHEDYAGARLQEFAQKWNISATNKGFEDPAEPFAQLQAGQYTGDLISFLHDWGQRAWRSDLLQPIDTTRLQYLDRLDDRWQTMNEVGQNRQWGIPYDVGLYPITYNTEVFSNPPNSWSVLWDEEYRGRITMQDSSIQACQNAALYTGQNPINPDDFQEIEEALMQQKPLVQSYWGTFESGMRLFVDGEVDVGQITFGRTVQAIVDHGANVNYSVPREGAMTYFDEFTIPKNANNVGTAYAWIDDYLQQGGPRFTELERYRATTANLTETVPQNQRELYDWSPDWNLVTQSLLDERVLQQYDQIWTRVKG
ncbi:ABC transporter substrate-binding protein [Haladaptatus halobius]|uniref:ABC transporter substrate-binding protein n=1 Tax=Haladaptatus halobius TaxID=2884875 RepID=UPI001D0AA2E5|nr:PotD/PotF family extracellular solute-binding protein [Haladaptatus halobius]